MDEVDSTLSKKEKIKKYLTSKVIECEKIIKKEKRKIRLLKYYTLV